MIVSKDHIDGADQIVLHLSLQQHVEMMSHYLPVARNLGQRRMYDTLRQIFYWRHIIADVACIVRNCPTCARKNLKYCHWRHMQPLPATGPLKFGAVDVVGSFSKNVQCNHYNVFVTDRISKRAWAVPTPRTTAAHVANLLMDHWHVAYGIAT